MREPQLPLSPALTLDGIAPGQWVEVTVLRGCGPAIQRLGEMGFVEGTPLRVVRYAPFGDPMEIEIHGYHLSIRSREAALIEVNRISAPESVCGRA